MGEQGADADYCLPDAEATACLKADATAWADATACVMLMLMLVRCCCRCLPGPGMLARENLETKPLSRESMSHES